MKRFLYLILAAVIAVSLAVSLTSCDVLNGLVGGGETEAEGPDLSGIKLADKTVTYNGEEHSLAISGDLPEGVTVEYTNNGKTDAGKYTVIAKFYYNGELIEGKDLSAQLRINKASLASLMEAISFPSKSFEYDGEAKSLAIAGELPAGVSVSYSNNGQTEVGTYTVTASFIVDTNNYYPVEDMTAKLTIKEAEVKIPEIDLSAITLEGKTVTYNGEAHSLAISGNLPEGVTVEYTNNGKVDAKEYTVTAIFYYNGILLEGKEISATLKIEKADIDLSGISFLDKTVLYTGSAQSIVISGELAHGVSVEYTNNTQTYPGEYNAVAKISAGKNYNAEELTATLTILPASIDLSGLSFKDIEVSYDGTPFSIYLEGIRPSGVTVEYIGNGVTEVGKHEVVAKFYYNGIYLEGQDLVAYIYINQGAEALKELVFEGATFTYDGTPKSIEVKGEIPMGFSIVGYEGNGEINAGKYTARVKFAYRGEHNADWDMVAEYTILPASLPAINVSDVTVAFDGGDHAIEYSAIDLPEGVSISVIGSAQYMPGTYKFSFKYVLSGDAAINYVAGDEVVANLTILEIGDDYVTDGIEYATVSGGVAVVGYTGESKLVVIPSTHGGKPVLAIKSLAFANNKNIKNVIIPNSVTAIGQGAFRGTELEEITVPFIGGSHNSSNKFFGYIFGASGYVANKYFVPETLEKVVISDACKFIPAYSFRGCAGIEEIVIGKNVTEIGISAFEKCASLKAIYIPATVLEIPAAANYYNSPFFDCGEDFKIYLEADSVPATGYGKQWNVLGVDKVAEVIYGVSYADYLAAKNA